MWEYIPGLSAFNTCDSEVHVKSDELNRVKGELIENKKTIAALKAALKTSGDGGGGSSKSIVVSASGDDADVAAYKNRIIELEARLEQRVKDDNHQIISLQIRLDQTIAAKVAAEKALLIAEAQNAQLRAELWRKPSTTPSTPSTTSSSSSSSPSSSSLGATRGAASPLPKQTPSTSKATITAADDNRGRSVSMDSLESCVWKSPDGTPRTPASSAVHSRQGSIEERDLDTISAINAFLKKLADDAIFQAKLKEETVQLAFAFWSGADTAHIESARADEIKQCPLVRSIYPILDEFEFICLESNVKIPLDHISGGKGYLNDETLTLTFGAAFCEKYGLLQATQQRSTPKGGWLFNY